MASAVVSVASSGNNEIVAAVSGRRIRVLGYVIVSSGAVNAKWRSASTDLSGAMSMVDGEAIQAPPVPATIGYIPDGWFMTAPGEALNLNLDGAVQVSGHIIYDLNGR